MEKNEKLEAVCHSIGLLLEELAQRRCKGVISEKSFVEIVLQIEAELVTPGGFTLTASNTRDDWTVFHVRMSGVKEACAAFDYLPKTGEFRRVGADENEAATASVEERLLA